MKYANIFGASICAAVVLTSCIDDKTLTQIQGTAIGGGGAAAAAYFTGQDPEVIAVTAAIGAIVGFEWGDSIAKKKAGYIAREDEIAADIEKLKERSSETATMNGYLETVISALEKTKSVKISEEQVAQINSVLAKGKSAISSDISAAMGMRKYARGSQAAELEAEVSGLKSELKALTSLGSKLQRLVRV